MHNETQIAPSPPTIEWLVARLNYAEPWDVFLVKSLKPFAESLVQAGIVERYFWQRGYERGAHIRLAMRGNTRVLHELVLPSLNEHFFRYVEDMPSARQLDRSDFEPNNSLQTDIYAPDTEGVGGEVGLPIFERFEQASSDAVLAFMAEKSNDWSRLEAAATAIKLHLGFADAVGMTAEEAMQFFEYFLAKHVKTTFSVQLFEYIFKRNETELVEFHRKIWAALRTNALFSERHYNRWLEQSYHASEDFKLTFRARTLAVEPRFSAIWHLYAQLLQATNQRLGLCGRHEALIFYTMIRGLESLG